MSTRSHKTSKKKKTNSKKRKKQKKAWRPAVRQAMYEATEREARNRHGKVGFSFNYRWEHVNAVVSLAARLAELTGADEDVVVAAAWLHDIRKESRDNHAIDGGKFARDFLAATDFPRKKIEAVAQAIETHMGLWRDKPLTDLESMVLWDADKLAKIGLTAAMHWVGSDLAGSKTRTLSDLIDRARSADWQVKTVASMHTKPARRAAKKRLASYNKLWDKLEKELSGKDLS